MTAQTQTTPVQAIQLKHSLLGPHRIIKHLYFMSLDRRHD